MVRKYQYMENGYLSNFGFREKPFGMGTDPKFLWLSERRREERDALLSAILYKNGYVGVTGDVGTGKTTFATALMKGLGDQVIAAKVPFPVDNLDFFKLISKAFGISNGFQNQRSFLVYFESFLRRSFYAGKKVVLIIDEAQRLTSENLQEFLHLSTIAENGTRLLTIVFVGQNEFNEILSKNSNSALRQRIVINYSLRSLTKEETSQYILHRLKVAQCEKDIFTPEAVEEIFLFSKGIPRLINTVCDLALLITYFEGEKIVRRESIKKSIQRLRVPNGRTEFGGSGSNFAPKKERKDGGGIFEKIKSELGMQRRVQNRAQVWAAYATGFGLLVVLLGFLFYLHMPAQIPQNSANGELRKKAGQKNKMDSRMREVVPAIASLAVEKLSLPVISDKNSDSAVLPQKASVSTEIKTPPGTDVPEVIAERQASVGSRVSASPDGPTLTAPLRDKSDPSDKETRGDEKRKSLLEATNGRMGSTPGFTPGRSDQKTASKEGKEIDPSKVIEWLIKRHSGKK
jgi:type II secretory pathway predicted ATPase ExeA